MRFVVSLNLYLYLYLHLYLYLYLYSYRICICILSQQESQCEKCGQCAAISLLRQHSNATALDCTKLHSTRLECTVI